MSFDNPEVTIFEKKDCCSKTGWLFAVGAVIVVLGVLGVILLVATGGYEAAEVRVVQDLAALIRLFDLGFSIDNFWVDAIYNGWGAYYSCSFFEDVVYAYLEDTASGSPTPEHSTTNNQVEGVDESDVVKIDGSYMYTLSMESIPVDNYFTCVPVFTISKIYPLVYNGTDSVGVLSRTRFPENVQTRDIALYGDYAVIFASHFKNYINEVNVFIYDISDKSNPILLRKIDIQGYYTGSRMIDGYIYIATSYSPNYYASSPQWIPLIRDSNNNKEENLVSFGNVFYVNTVKANSLITLTAISLHDLSLASNSLSLAGRSTIMYASTEAFYFVTSQYERNAAVTSIFLRIAYNELELTYTGVFEVAGVLINQFSMDEHSGYLRIASNKEPWTNEVTSVITVIDISTMKTVGQLNNIAPRERIKSVRFSGKFCYLVTFLEIDPFFVIDIRNPQNPEVIGSVKLPGFSEYLHILEDDRILGVGKLDWKNIKVSLFDVSDMKNPTEESTYKTTPLDPTADYNYDGTVVSFDHKAFLYNGERNLITFPIHQTSSKTVNGVYTAQEDDYAVILELIKSGSSQTLSERGKISHRDLISNLNDYDTVRLKIGRELFVENVVYTLSNDFLRAHDLITLDPLYSLRYTNDGQELIIH